LLGFIFSIGVKYLPVYYGVSYRKWHSKQTLFGDEKLEEKTKIEAPCSFIYRQLKWISIFLSNTLFSERDRDIF